MLFKLGCNVTVSAYTEVEADTLEEAIADAEQRQVALGGPHSGTDPRETWLIEDADGEPLEIHGLDR